MIITRSALAVKLDATAPTLAGRGTPNDNVQRTQAVVTLSALRLVKLMNKHEQLFSAHLRRQATFRRWFLWLLWLLCGSAAVRAAEGPFQPPEFSVPDGYEVQLVAGPPLVRHPMMACFDEQGRLYVAESAGLNLPRESLEEQLPNSVRLLEDTDGDGVFDRSRLFADKMTLPMGSLFYRGSLLVASPPHLWRLTDTNGDGHADRREILVGKFGYNGNAASIHGPFLGPDGRIYWCDGRHGHEIQDTGGELLTRGQAARIFSCLPDGTGVEVVCGGGMDNPVEVDFTPEGELLGTVNLFYRTRGDCLVHWMHGGTYPRYDQQAVLAEFPRTGELLPPVLDLGHVAVSGTVRYRGQALLDEAGRLPALSTADPPPLAVTSITSANVGAAEPQTFPFLVAEFNTNKVVCLHVQRAGSSFQARREVFLQSSSTDFRPTDVLEDADGSLLVIDTGGWFRIGCPNSQVAKPEIQGAIYRIRRQQAVPLSDPRGRDLDWLGMDDTTMASLLDDPRPAVRDRAIELLAQRGDTVLPVLADTMQGASPRARRNAVWALCRNGSVAARPLMRAAVGDEHESVRLAAVRSLGTLRDAQAVPQLSQRLSSDGAAVRREAATALGRCGEPDAIPGLLQALEGTTDRMLEHAILYALIEISEPVATAAGLSHASPAVRRGALIALDQMEGATLRAAAVAALAESEDAPLRDAALDVLARHPAWADELRDQAMQTLRQRQSDEARLALLRGALRSLAWDAPLQQVVADALSDASAPPELHQLLLELLSRPAQGALSAPLQAAMAACMQRQPWMVAQQAMATVAARGDMHFEATLRERAEQTRLPVAVRLAACEALARLGVPLSDELLRFVGQRCQADVEPTERLSAARTIAQAPLTAAQRERVLGLVAMAGPLELPLLLAAFALDPDPAPAAGAPGAAAEDTAELARRGRALVAALERSPGISGFPGERLAKLLAAYPPEVREAAAPLLGRLTPQLAEQALRLADLEQQLREGDVERGERVFFGARAACGACHRVGLRGGEIGPDLSEIGRIRSSRDLLEAVLLPSASLARGYEPYQVLTQGGRTFVGVIAKDDPQAIYLRTAERTEVRVLREEIESMVPSHLSIMPQGLEQLLTRDELGDLLTYLAHLGA